MQLSQTGIDQLCAFCRKMPTEAAGVRVGGVYTPISGPPVIICSSCVTGSGWVALIAGGIADCGLDGATAVAALTAALGL